MLQPHLLHFFLCPQIRLYIPETGNDASGIIRAIVKDSTDTANRDSYVDSDGRVAAVYESASDGPRKWDQIFLADNLWHMITLSTLTNNMSGLQGYAMYLDGQLMAYQAADQFYIGQALASLHLQLGLLHLLQCNAPVFEHGQDPAPGLGDSNAQ